MARAHVQFWRYLGTYDHLITAGSGLEMLGWDARSAVRDRHLAAPVAAQLENERI